MLKTTQQFSLYQFPYISLTSASCQISPHIGTCNITTLSPHVLFPKSENSNLRLPKMMAETTASLIPLNFPCLQRGLLHGNPVA